MTPEELARAFKGRPHLDSLWQKISSGVSDFTLEDQVELEVAEAHMHHERGNFATALKQGERALARAQGIKYTKGIASALQILALVYLRLGDYVQCAESARQSLSLDQGTLDAADAWRMLADCALFTDDFSNALIYFERAIKLSQKFGYTFGYLASLNSVSILHYAQGRFDQALTGYNEAGNHVEASDYAKSFCLINSASIYLTTNQRGQARDTMNRLAPYAEGSELIDAYLRVWRAWLAIDEEDFEHAETAFQHARTLVEAQGIAPVRQMLRIQYSRLQRLRGDSARALAWAKEAVKFAESTNSHWFVGVAMIERARAWWMLDDFVTTEKDLLSALDVAQNLGAEYLAAEATLLLAALRHRQKSADADATWLDAARRIKIGGYGFILERERALAFPLVAAQTRSRKTDVQSAASTMLENLSNIAPLPLRVFGLGRFEMWQGRRRIPSGEWQKRHSGELFRFLLLQPRHTAARDIIFESLCRDQSAESAQIYLHHATSTLRHLLEPELPDKFPSRYIVIEGEQVELCLPSGSWIDFEEFEQEMNRQLHESPGDLSPTSEEKTLKLYLGDLFPLDRYADWATDARERFTELYRRALLASGQKKLAAGIPQAALDTTRQILASDPWREDAVLLAMQACIALNNRPGALRVYRDLERHLQTDLQISPRKDLQDLAASLRN